MAPVGSTSVERSATKRRATGRAKGSGKRAAQVLAAVQDQPGITIPEIAAKLGIKPNYLYRVMPALQKDGKIVKRGKGWSPKG
jgi:DNA-binding IclR family transcriptional regulator